MRVMFGRCSVTDDYQRWFCFVQRECFKDSQKSVAWAICYCMKM